MSAGPPPSSSSFLHRTTTASSRSQYSLPDPNSKLWIKVIAGPQLQALDPVFPAGPEQQPLDQSVPRRASAASSGSKCSLRTSTASTRSECCPPDINHKESPKIYQMDCQKECQKIWNSSVAFLLMLLGNCISTQRYLI